jgi:hypothetical protein
LFPVEERMRIPIPHLTVRRLMVVVAAFALAFGAAQGLTGWMEARRIEFGRRSRQHDIEKSAWLSLPSSKESRAEIEYHSRWSIKYHLAIERPWLPVESDPPEPN